eukprot:TRINITY_DN43511_c0_g1_i1.p1 TRINITY_DN43511_c0_g1~~TRINITY_DN43511_c0_g1_i1.p1  ORF type:complete len:536 (+),score=97.60 TRINITY_DN43511_c0_g1_i1:105-1712(+)
MNQYETVKPLGRGAFGIAYLVKEKWGAEELRVVKHIDVARLPPEERIKAQHEAQGLTRLSHPNIVSHLTTFLESYTLCIVREFVDGNDLASVIKQRRQENDHLSDGEAVTTIVQCISALAHAHSLKILHRNLECHNIFLSKSTLKIGDFGIAKVVEFTSGKAAAALGAPGHLAPEVCNGLPFTSAADVWSVGVVLYTLLALRAPFESLNAQSLINKILYRDPEPLPQERGAEVCALVQTILQKQPENRPSVEELLVAPVVRRVAQSGAHEAADAVDRLICGAGTSNKMAGKGRMKEGGCAIDAGEKIAVGKSPTSNWSLRDAPPLRGMIRGGSETDQGDPFGAASMRASRSVGADGKKQKHHKRRGGESRDVRSVSSSPLTFAGGAVAVLGKPTRSVTSPMSAGTVGLRSSPSGIRRDSDGASSGVLRGRCSLGGASGEGSPPWSARSSAGVEAPLQSGRRQHDSKPPTPLAKTPSRSDGGTSALFATSRPPPVGMLGGGGTELGSGLVEATNKELDELMGELLEREQNLLDAPF